MFRIDPITKKQFKRFRSIRRGFVSFILLFGLVIFSCLAELFVNSRAVLVSYEGKIHFPTYGKQISGKTFGLTYDYETDYRELSEKFKKEGGKNFVIMPIVPFNSLENDINEGEFPPLSPSFTRRHFLGTDTSGRDVLARLIYGFRIAIAFSLILLVCNYCIGITIGSLMGYWGGWFDLLFQRLIEIWSNMPFLYVIIIVSSIFTPNFLMLILIMAAFQWMGITWYMRTTVYKQKAREYVLAAQSLGATNARIIFKHILPNSVSLIVTFIPFSVSGGIVSLTSLDYLGFGLPAPTPSWGELLSQGTTNLESPWILISVVVSMIAILTMVTFIGEAIREAFDPKLHSTYE